jgi:hypothetical protein
MQGAAMLYYSIMFVTIIVILFCVVVYMEGLDA